MVMDLEVMEMGMVMVTDMDMVAEVMVAVIT